MIGVLKITTWPRGQESEPRVIHVRLSQVQGLNLPRPCQIDAMKMSEEEYYAIQAMENWQDLFKG